MAQLRPTDIYALEQGSAHPGEVETLKMLAKALPNDYTVYHSVHWSNSGRDRKHFGEIDFVIVNRSGAILLIEQKDGPLIERNDGLIKRYSNGQKCVTSQILRSVGSVRDKFREHMGGNDKLSIEHLIYCPDYRVVNVEGVGIDMDRTVDAAAKDQLAARIEQLLGPGAAPADTLDEVVQRFFDQCFHIQPDVGAFVSTQEQTFTCMLEGLDDVIAKLEFAPFRLRVVGTAGCGKTQLTLSHCERLVAAGRHPLLLCFNRPLADLLQPLAPAGVTVDTYYGFCKSTLEALTGVTITPTDDESFWRDLQDRLVAAEIPDEYRFDALVVDEGQDFHAAWWEILELFLTDDASVLWLEDPLQNLRGTEEFELPEFVTYRESANFRTPHTVAEFIKEALPVEFEQRNPLPGLGVQVQTHTDAADLTKKVAHRVVELTRAGFSYDEIAIISCVGRAKATFAECDKVGSVPLRRFTGKYAGDAQVYTDGKLLFDTIRRFKGQQSPAVILVDLDASLKLNDKAERLLYCGMSRATVRLEVMVAEDCPWRERLVAAAN